MQRNGETIDQGLVKKVVDSFVSLGLDESDINKVSYEVYKEHFESPFLEATEKYYRKESEQFLAENSVPDYMKKAEERLRDLTVSLGCTGKGALGDLVVAGDVRLASMADGGSSNDIWSDDSCLAPSWPLISVDDAGVGSIAGRGIFALGREKGKG